MQHESYQLIGVLTILTLLHMKGTNEKIIEARDYMLLEDMFYIRLNLMYSLNLWLLVPVYVVLSICDDLELNVSHGLMF